MTIWIWFKNDETMEIRDVDYYDASQMDGFVRIKTNHGRAKICIADSEIRMIGEREDIFCQAKEKDEEG